jgi:predicted acetyltransferase
MDRVIQEMGIEQHEEFIAPIYTTMGLLPVPERIERLKRIPELTSRLAAFEDGRVVGGAGSYTMEMTTPGGAVEVAGLTMVAVVPTHRRRGILQALMRRHLDDAHALRQPVAALWASEAPIYGRFGYGLASQACSMSIERAHAAFQGKPGPAGRARLLGESEALEALPPVWERARAVTPGMLSRSSMWWQSRRLNDAERAHGSGGPIQRVVIEVDGRPEAYAIYRINHRMDASHIPVGTAQVFEAVGASPHGTRLIWRYLFDIDLVERIEAMLLPVDHPLTLLTTEPRRLRLTASDALWVRIIDVEAALAARAYDSRESLVLELEDAFCPWNAGRYLLDGGARQAARTAAEPDLRLDVRALGSAYLGGFSFRRLADAGHVETRTEEAIDRADRLFRSPRAPWCPEIF